MVVRSFFSDRAANVIPMQSAPSDEPDQSKQHRITNGLMRLDCARP